MSLSKLYKRHSISTDRGASGVEVAKAESTRTRFRVAHLPAWAFPSLLVAAFTILFAVVARDRLLPAVPVMVTPAILLADVNTSGAESLREPQQAADESDARRFDGEVLFQAAGWFEPDPLPTRATALVDGVVESVHVLEGESVAKDQLLAKLIAEDATFAVSAAESALEQATAEHDMHLVSIPALEADVNGILDRITAGRARLSELEDTLNRLSKLSKGAASEQQLIAAKLAVDAKSAEVRALHSELEAARARLAATRAETRVFEAKIAGAKVILAEKKLALSRTEIRSPVEGIVLDLKAAPGQKKMLSMDEPDSATIAVLFEPENLQARVDVPLADAAGLRKGQSVILSTEFLPNTAFHGVVDRIVGAADLQRNTLQAKVRILDPDPRLRPEMLCRAKFLEPNPGVNPSTPKAGTSRSQSRVVMIPESTIDTRNGDKTVWVVDETGSRAQKRSISLDAFSRDGYLAVRSGVLAGELIIHPPHNRLREGKRIRVERHPDR